MNPLDNASPIKVLIVNPFCAHSSFAGCALNSNISLPQFFGERHQDEGEQLWWTHRAPFGERPIKTAIGRRSQFRRQAIRREIVLQQTS
jgi:hypothetical protein